METFFGRVPAEYLSESNDYFFGLKDVAYYFKATLCHCNEQVVLQDTAGRYIPIDVEYVKDLAFAFTMLGKRIEAEKQAEQAYEDTLNSYVAEIEQNTADWNLIRA